LPTSFPSFLYDTPPPTAIYTLSLHDALPIWQERSVPVPEHLEVRRPRGVCQRARAARQRADSERGQVRELARLREPRGAVEPERSEEHTSELQSRSDLVCRLLLEKKKKK